MNDNTKKVSITMLLTAGIMPAAVLHKVNDLQNQFGFDLYVTTQQNMRLLNVAEGDAPAIREELQAAGVTLKKPGLFPSPKVCVGQPYCKLALVDAIAIGHKIWERFGHRQVKPKFKTAVAGCPASCSHALVADIGIVATRKGFNLYLGGKGGSIPRIGRLYRKNVPLEAIFTDIEAIVDFHDRKTVTKQRLFKLLEDPEFPIPLP